MIKANDQNYDVPMSYNLSNHKKAPVKRRNQESILIIESFHGRISVLSALFTQSKLKIYNYLNWHYCESVVHSGLMIEIIILKIVLLSCIMRLFIV